MPNYEIIYTVEAPDVATALSAAQYGVDQINAITTVQGSIVQQVKDNGLKLPDGTGVKRLTEPFQDRFTTWNRELDNPVDPNDPALNSD